MLTEHDQPNAPEIGSIKSTPKEHQIIQHEGKAYNTIREGKAYILIPENTATITEAPTFKGKKSKQVEEEAELPQKVFYNPIQQFNRDLSVIAIRAFGEDHIARRIAKKKLLDEKGRGGKRAQVRKSAKVHEDTEETRASKRQKVEHDGDESSDALTEQPTEIDIDGASTTEAKEAPSGQQEIVRAAQAPVAERQEDKNGKSADESSSTWKPRLRILDALSATGLRALRYAQELPFPVSVTANDLLDRATASIRLNVEHNALGSQIKVNTSDARAYMYQAATQPPGGHGLPSRYEVIDLDPYGTAVPFLDAALQALNDGGMLCVTCTDAGVWASTGYLEKTFALYGGLPLKGIDSHEGGVRLILHAIATQAAKYGLAIEPLLSLSIDFYARVFVRVRRSPADVKFLAGKTMIVYSCDSGCGSRRVQWLARHNEIARKIDTFPENWKYHLALAPVGEDVSCEHCGYKMHLAGPMWGGPLHNPVFVQNMLRIVEGLDQDLYQTKNRMEGILYTALEELTTLGDLSQLLRYDKIDSRADLDPAQEQSSGHIDSDGPQGISTNVNSFIPATKPSVKDLYPFFFNLSVCAKVFKSPTPLDADIKGALRHMNYVAARTHCKPGMIKTNAPWSVVWRIFHAWVEQKTTAKPDRFKEGSVGMKVWSRSNSAACAPKSLTSGSKDNNEATNTNTRANTDANGTKANSDVQQELIVFDAELGKNHDKKRLIRYQINPRANWGPMSRAIAKHPDK